MKKIISFEKKIEFPSMIGEITSISLDHNLKFIDSSNIEGNFIVSGTYKLTEASRIEEPFEYELPSEILLSEKIDTNSSKIDIEDFYYEIENDYNLICYIDLKVEGVEIVEIEEPEPIEPEKNQLENITEAELEDINLKIESIDLVEQQDLNRECDGEIKNETEEEREPEEIMKTEPTNTMSSIFENISQSEETYSTYSVYILREEETVTSLINKYKTTKEELESYNDLSNLSIGSKIIIPLHDE